jgi:hypothetical protein
MMPLVDQVHFGVSVHRDEDGYCAQVTKLVPDGATFRPGILTTGTGSDEVAAVAEALSEMLERIDALATGEGDAPSETST